MQTATGQTPPTGAAFVATKDYLPGELILEEKAILMLTKQYVEDFAIGKRLPEGMAVISGCYAYFKEKLTAETKAKVLNLFQPTKSIDMARSRNTARFYPGPPLTPEEVEIFMKLSIVMSKSLGFDGGTALFAGMTNVVHSCDANCHYIISQNPVTIRCRALRHIAAGETLTFSLHPERNLKPIHERRQKYLEESHFTCHCPRCDAPGDDTRQFDCFDPACKGVMMVCQPINSTVIALPELQYTGVEYVEPHLLPCTVCGRAAPAAYQAKMFLLETKLPALAEKCTSAREKARRDVMQSKTLQDKILNMKLPLRHALCLPIHKVLLGIAPLQVFNLMTAKLPVGLPKPDLVAVCREHVQRAAQAYTAAQEGITPGPCMDLLDVLLDVCHTCVGNAVTLTPFDAKTLLQRTLRMYLLLLGRDTDRAVKDCAHLDTHLLQTLTDLPFVEPSMEVCAFCEESPASAFMKRSRCGACKKVMYCSAGCQKAHWKLHKKTCAV